ncbi:hypothetical protein F2P56_020434 [Juglans regia]|nr:hypothetical protein F2P56_020434 [Juglans regia]
MLGRGSSEKLEGLSENGGGSLGSASGTERENDGIEVNMNEGKIFGETRVNSIGNSLSKAEYKEVLTDNDGNVREEVKDSRLGQNGTERETRFHGRHVGLPERPEDYWARGDDHDHTNMNRSEFVGSSTGENSAWLRSSTNRERWGVERDGFGGFYRNPGAVASQREYPTFAYPYEGPSNFQPDSFYGYGEQIKHDSDFDGRNKVEQLECNRAELLRKLDKLKDQVSRSRSVDDKPLVPVDRTLPDPNVGRDVYKAPDRHLLRPPYFNHTHGNVPFMNLHNMGPTNFHPPPRHVMNEFPVYDESYQPQMTRKPLHQPLSQYPQREPHEYLRRQYMEFNQDPFASYQPKTFYNQPACSCSRCLEQSWQVPPRIPATVFGNRRIQRDSINSNFYHHDELGPQSYNAQFASPAQLTSRDPLTHKVWTSELDSDVDGLGDIRPRLEVAAQGNRLCCHPVADGAPFITCYNCFELLKLPRKLKTTEKNRQKLRCGGCSTIIVFEILNKKLIISVPEETKQISAEAEDGSEEVLNESDPSSDGCLDAGNIHSCLVDFHNSGHNLDLTHNRQGPKTLSISSCPEGSPDTVILQGNVSHTTEQPLKDDLSPKHSVSKYGQGNNSKRVDQDKEALGRITSRQNSIEDMPVATELDVSFNDYLNTCLSQDSVEASKEKDLPKTNKSSSFFVGFIKKSLREFSTPTQSLDEKLNVSVNGHPIPDHLVKKAEKLAGPIQSGDYWYDPQAGFWGVMGHTCLGIIPPFIEEFNYPMPTNCAGGNTGVHVNGRELNQKDLDLLVSRGLPPTGDKFYLVEISGRVVDEDSGKELDGLGKLAPTVEKAKHGFGMKVPRRFRYWSLAEKPMV